MSAEAKQRYESELARLAPSTQLAITSYTEAAIAEAKAAVKASATSVTTDGEEKNMPMVELSEQDARILKAEKERLAAVEAREDECERLLRIPSDKLTPDQRAWLRSYVGDGLQVLSR
jgi:uncharacterized protein YecT (DUF1311 family)